MDQAFHHLLRDHEFGVRALVSTRWMREQGCLSRDWHLFTSRETAIFAALLYCAMLLISAGAIIITPDTPLVFFWSIALYALVRIFCGGGSGWWWIVGIAMGLALQSKYTALLLGAGIVARWPWSLGRAVGGGTRRRTLRVCWH